MPDFRTVRIVLPPSKNSRPSPGYATKVYDAMTGRDLSSVVTRVTMDLKPDHYPVATIETMSPELDLTLDAEVRPFEPLRRSMAEAATYRAALEAIVAKCDHGECAILAAEALGRPGEVR